MQWSLIREPPNLRLALDAAESKEGDEVIVSTITFDATAEVVLNLKPSLCNEQPLFF
jgi:DegT/DnrJ/EryC1/StrS aminotransferase family